MKTPSINLEKCDQYGNTYLLVAAYLGADKCVNVLLKHGVKVFAKNYYGKYQFDTILVDYNFFRYADIIDIELINILIESIN